jgi:hypothetical protein
MFKHVHQVFDEMLTQFEDTMLINLKIPFYKMHVEIWSFYDIFSWIEPIVYESFFIKKPETKYDTPPMTP